MSTVGNMARIQLNMSQAAAKTGVSSSGLFSSNLLSTSKSTSSSSSTSTSDALESILKNKSDYFKAQYTKLYNSIFPSDEDTESADKTVTVKSAANALESSSEALVSFGNSLDFDGTVDTDEAAKKIQSFVDDYNDMVGALGESDNQSVLQKGVVMVNTTKVYTSALKRVGITVGSDNKLTFDKDKLSDVKSYELKSTFGRGGYASKINQKADQISSLQGSSGGLFSYSGTASTSYTYNLGTLLSTYA